jgi:hypothetical protein
MERYDETLGTRDLAGATMTPQAEAEAEPESRDVDTGGPLLHDSDQSEFEGRWAEIQAQFVDEPRRAVEDADELVAALMKRLAEGFAEERDRLEGVWARGEDVGTEDLRVALQRYRAFFQRLLAT